MGGDFELGTGSGWRLSTYAARAQEDLDFRLTGQVDFAKLLEALMTSDEADAFNPFGDGSSSSATTLARIRSESSFASRSTLASIGVSSDGPLMHLPAGEAKLAVGADYRHQGFDSSIRSGEISSARNPLSRDIVAAFSELLVPLAREDQHRKALRVGIDLEGRLVGQ